MTSDVATIFALSTGQPPSGIAVVRVSGPSAHHTLRTLAKRLPAPRRATRAALGAPDGSPIDDALILWFPGPHSATGEDVAEFHVHGGRAVINALTWALQEIPGLRPAEPGEFSLRAFENGKLDLTEAEGLDDLIHADTEQQRRRALRQLAGSLGNRARTWRQQIIEASALIEAGIDFSDEGDIPSETTSLVMPRIQALQEDILAALKTSGRSERIRDGLVVAITGPPNVGKSTLMNRLAQREVAIVSPHAGTTRDVLELHMDLAGYPVTLIDTAGLRETDDPVEKEGVRRARARAEEADLRLWLIDATSVDDARETIQAETDSWLVRNKTDLATLDRAPIPLVPSYDISAQSGAGVDELVAAITSFSESFFGSGSSPISRARHRVLLESAADALGRALEAEKPVELLAEDLRVAADELGRLLGRVDVDDVLGSIFSQFCIGK